VATTEVSAASARLRRSSSQSGKYEPERSFADGDVEGAGAGVEVAVPVAVAGVDPLRRAGAVFGAAHRVGLGGHQRVDECGQQRAQQVG
jgi:hypothetical protein